MIIEDEPAAREILQRNISQCPDLECCGSFEDPFSAQTFLDKNSVDLIFLDINLPGMSGVSFLRTLIHPPLVIITTAYPQYAVDGFDLEVVDFLLKPFSFERFSKAVNKAKERLNGAVAVPANSRISVKCDRRIYQIGIEDILYVEACGDYVTLCCTGRKLVVHGTLKSWEEKLSGYSFLKVHRISLVNISKIDHVEGNTIHLAGHKLLVSENYKQNLYEQLFGHQKS